MRILVTGGLGYIGSHTVVELIQNKFDVIIIDNLSNSELFILDNIKNITGVKPIFYNIDLVDFDKLNKIFISHKIDGVIHFAAFKSVSESVKNPLKYYENNLISLLNILKSMKENNVSNIVFSSSCTVYGQPEKLPVSESSPFKNAESPYAKTKQISEHIIKDFTNSHNKISSVSLRYFNPIGAHESGLIGELPMGVPDNLIPYLTQTAAGLREELSVFGKDYNTHDGTAIRDYIHVEDLAKAHLKAFNFLDESEDRNNYEFFNVGTGIGYSVLDIINSFENINNLKLKYSFKDRRDGDIEDIYSDVIKSKKILKWESKRSLDDMMSSSWKWQKNLVKF
ncbi:MAG: UDP-glucose 4-epimerase GalE [Flammeovirgaceae bacterium]|nr:UDP-glucose 4-epimerase GalE [Flammeovirgaceae bacterium]